MKANYISVPDFRIVAVIVASFMPLCLLTTWTSIRPTHTVPVALVNFSPNFSVICVAQLRIEQNGAARLNGVEMAYAEIASNLERLSKSAAPDACLNMRINATRDYASALSLVAIVRRSGFTRFDFGANPNP